jgi:hypothetical protein
MLSITGILTIALITGIGLGMITRNPVLRIAGWCIAGICALGPLLFFWTMPNLLRR